MGKDFVASRDGAEKQTSEEKEKGEGGSCGGGGGELPTDKDAAAIGADEMESSSWKVDLRSLIIEPSQDSSPDSSRKSIDSNGKDRNTNNNSNNNNSTSAIVAGGMEYRRSQLRNGNDFSPSRPFVCHHFTKRNTEENGKTNYSLSNSSHCSRSHPVNKSD